MSTKPHDQITRLEAVASRLEAILDRLFKPEPDEITRQARNLKAAYKSGNKAKIKQAWEAIQR